MTAHPDPEQLSAYLDHELAADERARLGAHLGICARCQAIRSALEASMRAVAAIPPVTPTAAEAGMLRARVLDQIHHLGRQQPAPGTFGGLAAAVASWRRRFSWRVYAAAAAVAVLLAGGIGLAALDLGSGAQTAAGPAGRPSVNRTAHAAGSGAAMQPGGSARGAAGASARLAFSSPDQAWAYVAGQSSSLSTSAENLNAGDAVTATDGFLESLAAQAGSSGTVQAGIAAGSAPQTGALVPAGPVPSGTAAATPSPGARNAPALPPGSLAACVSAVQALVPTPSVPIEALAVTYQGRPAWLLVYASAVPANPQGPLTQQQTWLRSQPGCQGIASNTVNP